MKAFVSLLFCMACAAALYAQNPVPEPDTLKNPVRKTDPTPQTTAPDVNYTKNKIKITAAELPERIQDALASGAQYDGWKTADIFRDKAGETFVIEIPDGEGKRVFRFDKTGRPLRDE